MDEQDVMILLVSGLHSGQRVSPFAGLLTFSIMTFLFGRGSMAPRALLKVNYLQTNPHPHN